MRVAVIHIGQETDTFNPRFTTWADFESFGIYRGAEIFEHLRGLGQVGGYLDIAEARGDEVESIPIVRGWAGAGGRIDRRSHEAFLDDIRQGLGAAGQIDGLALQLHGACAADGEDDVEGAQLALCREILGDAVPIVLSLDHHANITSRMVELSTAVVGHRTQPHDPFDTGRLAAELLFRIIDGEVDPVMAWRKLPLLSHQEQYLTSQGPMKAWFDRARAAEADRPEVLAVSNFPMQPWRDVLEGGWATVVVTDGAPTLAEELADELGDLAWSMRAEFQVKTSVAVDAALTDAVATDGMVLLSDTGDSVFGGSAGDSNIILEAALRLGIDKTILIPLVSPDVVATLWEAGEGATVTLLVGGETTPFYEPLEVTGVVRRLRSGPVDAIHHSLGSVDMGRTAILEVGPAILLVSELRGLGGNVPEVYRACDVEPQDHGIVVLKTASNFQYFQPMATKVIRVDTPGPTQSDIVDLPWERVPRPIFPLDEMTEWRT